MRGKSADYPNWDRYEKCCVCGAKQGEQCTARSKCGSYDKGEKMRFPHHKRKVKILIHGGVPCKPKGMPREWRCLNPKPGVIALLCKLDKGHKSNHRNGKVIWERLPNTGTVSRPR